MPVYAHSASGNRNYTSGAMNNVGTNGNYWSASPSSETNGYNMNFNSSSVNPANTNNRSNGRQVRPVLELNKTKKNTLQDQHPRVFSRVLKLYERKTSKNDNRLKSQSPMSKAKHTHRSVRIEFSIPLRE
ncbi:MAG: hypothetical protein SNG97_06580 [Rikenellaceae bacterium]